MEKQNNEGMYGINTESNTLNALTYETCELFFSRIVLSGLDWGDIVRALKDLKKEDTFDDWDDWHSNWVALGKEYAEKGEIAESGGHYVTASQYYQRAAACHHFGEFMYFDKPKLKKETRQMVTRLFHKAIPHLGLPIEVITIKHEDLAMPGYFISADKGRLCPTVVLINGLDSAKEVELMAFAREFLQRGMSVLLFDGPGQGLFAGGRKMEVNFEEVVASVLSYLEERKDVSIEKIGLFGVSYGGYLAARAAAAHPFQVKACINLSGGFDHDDYDEMNVMVKKDFRFVFGIESDEEMSKFSKSNLSLRDVPALEVPLLCIHGTNDTIIPYDSCLRMMEWAEGESELLSYEGERHVCTNFFNDYIAIFSDWMKDRLESATGTVSLDSIESTVSR